ncbi:ATP-binding cassette domain-containing protein [Euzebya tangerina]|uniref:ATP-binding cassette domain-containing protein n=1 Tax=Euzebya tangerina TaxID=591198 RepID=UPI000E31B7E2|nr:ATP-binding cassette domain-containing protein [Euzebya tangerina]
MKTTPDDAGGSRQANTVPAIEVAGVTKVFGTTRALDGVDLTVKPGGVVGLLGPNGAGKTTLVRVLATLLSPTDGYARIFGTDVTADPHRVREQISLTGQYAAVDGLLTGRENLLMFAELLQLTPASAQARADELLERFSLGDAADRRAATYSGGMRRRLDLASSVILPPKLLFLDEPTTGLDPRTRNEMWDVIRELVSEGTTLLLTTQYLEEADQLANRIVVIDAGKIIADGTGDELKEAAGGITVEILLGSSDDIPAACQALQKVGLTGHGVTAPTADLEVPTTSDDGLRTVQQVAGALREANIVVNDLGLRRASLDEVFLQLTGDENGAPSATSERSGGTAA